MFHRTCFISSHSISSLQWFDSSVSFIESIAFLRTLAEFDNKLNSEGDRGPSIILFTPLSYTTHGTLRHTSVMPNSDSTSVETDNNAILAAQYCRSYPVQVPSPTANWVEPL